MGGETANIADVAKAVSKDIFKSFGWDDVGCYDENFICHKQEEHGGNKIDNGFKNTHPTDCVFKYFDPYKNRCVYLHTDLKSYAKSSISKKRVEKAISSLAKSIDCARGSAEWIDRYVHSSDSIEVRGMLFIYNHDGGFDKDFYGYLSTDSVDKIPLKRDQIIHVIDPIRIRYLYSVVSDIKHLAFENEIPKKYSFFYPDLFLHKPTGDDDCYPATVELLTAPYMILRYNEFKFDRDGCEITEQSGYVIYYNKPGSTHYEFMYLLDSLSRYQLLGRKETIRIRVAHHSPDPNIVANYRRAVQGYLEDWGLDENKATYLKRIDFGLVQVTVPAYNPGALSWRDS